MRISLTSESLLGMVTAPVIWAAHFLGCYVLVSLACAYGFTGISFGIAMLTMLALALLAGIGLANWRKLKRLRSAHCANLSAPHTSQSDHGGSDLGLFFALTSMMLCALSALALLWVAFPAAVLPTCAA